MNWLNLHIPTTTRNPKFIGCKPVQRATWLSLITYCAEQENGGVILLCKNWGNRRWMQTCGVTKKEVESVCELWKWTEENLVLWAYPVEKEQEVKLKREGGRVGGLRSGQSRAEAELQAELQRKGKEGEVQVQPPIVPQGGLDLGLKVVPSSKPWQPDPFQFRLNALFKRRPTTQWNRRELKAYREARINDEDLRLIESYYTAPHENGHDYRRRDILTLLNNWTGEIDRARNFKPVKKTCL